jgi:hypothetical protein
LGNFSIIDKQILQDIVSSLVAVEIRTREAAHQVLSQMQRTFLRPHGIIPQTAEENGQRIRALDGLCGDCAFLKVEIVEHKGRKRVALECFRNNSPVGLYRRTPLGEVAECSDFSPSAGFGPPLVNNLHIPPNKSV